MHRHLGEDTVAHLREHGHQHPRQAVEHGEQDRRAEQPRPRGVGVDVGRLRGARHGHQRIGRPLEGEGRDHRHALGEQEQAEGDGDPRLQIATPVRPQMRPQA